jgi:hypothetical protein
MSLNQRACFALLLPLALTAPVDSRERADIAVGTRSETVCRDSACFDARAQVGTSTVPLRNTAMLEIWGFDVYTAALYVPPGTDTIDEVLETAPKTLVLHYHRSIKAKQIIKAANKALDKNPEVDRQAIESRLERIYDAFQDVEEGDRYELRHHPQQGAILALNGEVTCIVEGDDFAEAFFGIWLSKKPLNDSLRDDLIGLDS